MLAPRKKNEGKIRRMLDHFSGGSKKYALTTITCETWIFMYIFDLIAPQRIAIAHKLLNSYNIETTELLIGSLYVTVV